MLPGPWGNSPASPSAQVAPLPSVLLRKAVGLYLWDGGVTTKLSLNKHEWAM